MLCEFELGHDTVESTKKIFVAKGESAIHYSNEMIQEILLELQEPQQSGKVS